MTISRRNAIAGLGAGALTIAAGAVAQNLRPTPQETLGPFYPLHPPAEDYDLTQVPGRPGRALGQVIEVSGRVLRIDGTPANAANIEIWQANAAGRYSDPRDTNPAPLDPDFEGVALLRTSESGRYLLRTIKPSAYPVADGRVRTPHIHFNVIAPGRRLVTQMYFPGEALNEKDMLFSTMAARQRDPALNICREVASNEPGVLRFEWDVVLAASHPDAAP